MTMSTWLADLKILASMAKGLPTSGGAASQLDSFYAPQAAHYDRFREKLLHGRAEMLQSLGIQAGHHVAEIGAGTGRTVEFYRDQLDTLGHVDLVDLCEPLLRQAQARLDNHPKVSVHHADACTWAANQPLDRVYFSYSLTMIPPWFAAIDNAYQNLAAGGLIGVVDFQVAPRGGSSRGFKQGKLGRFFWPFWLRLSGTVQQQAKGEQSSAHQG
jgi:S-adenosylmethionine-diacylgycerolhomoserine-N-methlytransferase